MAWSRMRPVVNGEPFLSTPFARADYNATGQQIQQMAPGGLSHGQNLKDDNDWIALRLLCKTRQSQ